METTVGTLSAETIAKLHRAPILESLTDETMHCLDGAHTLLLKPDDVLIRQGELKRVFWILLEGSLRVSQAGPKGHELTVHTHEAGAAFGEVFLLANIASTYSLRAVDECELLELDEEQFWALMMSCPLVRRAILGNMALRLQKMQGMIFQQEKMAALGTMAAGLMHELNNPGAAARRASSQLRENLTRMHRLTQKWSRTELTQEQKQCMFELQEYALSAKEKVALNSLEQSDAEEKLAEWMEENSVEDAWKMAPSLVAMGMHSEDLECARRSFAGETFPDALNWLEAMVSSMRLVGSIEESIGRVSDLVMAVKSYAYEGRGQTQTIDINKSIHATLVMLGHKLREKQLVIEKNMAPDLPILQTDCQGLNQIWTNLIDNAIDASFEHGTVKVKTWAEPGADGQTELCIRIEDNGSGIPLESQPKVFDPFYTTKAAGVGTGLGLGIVYKIVEQFGGKIWFSSTPGETVFLVRLPNKA
ncbi:sensor histidine kinase [Granulicella tundricola]|nr:ATP-binding protein [Granulicella tundricola]